MRTRYLLAVAVIVCVIAGTVGASAASANQAVFFNKNISLKSFAVSGTPRSTLFAGGGELSEDTGSWEFCVAADLNGNRELAQKTCSAGNGFLETFGTVAARAWVEVRNKKGSTFAHLVAEEFW